MHTWCCGHAKFCVEVFYELYINVYWFIYLFIVHCITKGNYNKQHIQAATKIPGPISFMVPSHHNGNCDMYSTLQAVPPSPSFTPITTLTACSKDPTHQQHPHLDSKLSHLHTVLLLSQPQPPAPVILHTWSIPTWTPSCPIFTLFYCYQNPNPLLQLSYTPGASPPGL